MGKALSICKCLLEITVRGQAREAQQGRQEAGGQMRRRPQREREGKRRDEALEGSVVWRVLGQWLPGQTGLGSLAREHH